MNKKGNSNNRSGRFTFEEQKYIGDACSKMDYRDIAKKIRRNPETIKRYIRKHHPNELIVHDQLSEYDIQKTPVWKDLQAQFSNEELAMFLHHWGRIIAQFKDDVYPTEELQIVDTIKMEIMMNRTVTQQHQIVNEIHQLEYSLTAEKEQEQPDMARASELERQIAVLRASQESLNKSYLDLLKEKNAILKSMKATRDARVKQLEQNKHNFLNMLRKIVQDRQFRHQLGIEMEKHRLSAKVEFERLSEYHEYEDGEVDQPILTPENVQDD